MTPEQLDEFQAWLLKQACEAGRQTGFGTHPYFSGRVCAFHDAFEYLSILRMQASQPTNASPSATEAGR